MKLLNWFKPYFVERDTSTNFQPTQSVELDEGDEEEEINDGLDNRSVASEDSFMSSIATKPNDASRQKNNVKKISSATPNAPRKSVVTGRPAFKKHKKEETDMDAELMSTLKERLEAKKDENQLYADLLAAKLRKLTKLNKVRAKHEIDNLMFKCELQDVEIAQQNQPVHDPYQIEQQSPNRPPVTPLFLFASSSVYQPRFHQFGYQFNHQTQQQQQQQQAALLGFSTFTSNSGNKEKGRKRFLAMVDSEPSQDYYVN